MCMGKDRAENKKAKVAALDSTVSAVRSSGFSSGRTSRADFTFVHSTTREVIPVSLDENEGGTEGDF